MVQPCETNPLIPALNQHDHLFGSTDAPIVLMQYGDYECPRSCQSFFSIKQLEAELRDSILFVFRHFPQTHLHPQAQKAAETAEAAAAQNQFWQMHTLLCQNSQALADSDLVEYAVQLNLDVSQLLSELAAHVHRDHIQQDVHSAQQLGIQETPTFFIGVRCQPNQDVKTLLKTILQALPLYTKELEL